MSKNDLFLVMETYLCDLNLMVSMLEKMEMLMLIVERLESVLLELETLKKEGEFERKSRAVFRNT